MEAYEFLARPTSDVYEKCSIRVLADILELFRCWVNVEPLRRIDQPSRAHVVVKRLLLFRVLLQEAKDRTCAVCEIKQCHFAWVICELMDTWSSHVFHQSTALGQLSTNS